MTNADIAKITAAVIAALGAAKPAKSYGKVAARKPYAPKLAKVELDPKVDRQLQRYARIAKGFKARGIDVTFDKATGRFDNVKPYKLWIMEGRRVMKGQHGVLGLFHISQTQVDVVPDMPSVEGVAVTVLPAQSSDPERSTLGFIPLSSESVLIPANR